MSSGSHWNFFSLLGEFRGLRIVARMLVSSVTPGLASVSICVFTFESGDGTVGF